MALKSRARDEGAIRALEAAYDAAWQRGEVDGVVACLTENALMVNPLGQTARGRAQIKATLNTLLNGPAKGSTHKSHIVRVEFITDEVAIVDGVAMLEDFAPSDEAAKSSYSHRFTDVVVRERDSWAIAHIRAYLLMPSPD